MRAVERDTEKVIQELVQINQSAQGGNDRMENVAQTKLLNFNISKSCYTIFGSKQRRLEIEKNIELCPL